MTKLQISLSQPEIEALGNSPEAWAAAYRDAICRANRSEEIHLETWFAAALAQATMIERKRGHAQLVSLATGLQKFAPDLADELVKRWTAHNNALDEFIAVLRAP